MAVVKGWKTTRDGFAEQWQQVAPRDGQYLLNGVPFRTFTGQPLPEGAVMVPTAEELAVKAETLPENKAEPAPATKSKRKPKAAE